MLQSSRVVVSKAVYFPFVNFLGIVPKVYAGKHKETDPLTHEDLIENFGRNYGYAPAQLSRT